MPPRRSGRKGGAMESVSSMMPDLYEPHGELRTKVWYLLPLRLYMGMYFLIAGFTKVSQGMLSNPSALSELMVGTGPKQWAMDSSTYPYPFYRAIFHATIEPNIGLFAFMVVTGEICSGFALLTGTLTRWTCVAAGFMMVNFFLASHPSLGSPTNTTAFMAMLLVVFLGNGGLAYGMDHYLRGKVPRIVV